MDIKIYNKLIKDIRLAIFDRDGTLINLYTYWSWMVAKRAEIICEKLKLEPKHKKQLMYIMGVDIDAKRIRTQGPVGVKKREIVMQAANDYLKGIGINDGEKICMEAFHDTDRLSLDSLSEIIHPITGLYELFKKIKDSYCNIAIATTDKTDRAKLAVKHLRLDHCVDYVIGTDSVKNPKPAPDMINLVLKRLSVEPKNAVMIGDAIIDVEMGLSAKLAASIGVCTGIDSREALHQKTEYVIDNIAQIVVV